MSSSWENGAPRSVLYNCPFSMEYSVHFVPPARGGGEGGGGYFCFSGAGLSPLTTVDDSAPFLLPTVLHLHTPSSVPIPLPLPLLLPPQRQTHGDGRTRKQRRPSGRGQVSPLCPGPETEQQPRGTDSCRPHHRCRTTASRVSGAQRTSLPLKVVPAGEGRRHRRVRACIRALIACCDFTLARCFCHDWS